MSLAKRRYLAERWHLTAKEDYRAAEVLKASEVYAQACFLCQQSAAKALKALWYSMDSDPWGQSVLKLVVDVPGSSEWDDLNAWIKKASLLDKYYIPTRYPADCLTSHLVRFTDAKTLNKAYRRING